MASELFYMSMHIEQPLCLHGAICALQSFLAEKLHQSISSQISRRHRVVTTEALEAAFEEVNAKVRSAQMRGGSTALVLCAMPATESVYAHTNTCSHSHSHNA